MTRRFFGLQGALLGGLLLGSCKQDSITTVGIGTPAGVSLEFKTRTMSVADSVRTFALVRDQVGNPLALAVTLTTGCTAGVVSIGTASDAPLVRTAFVVRALGYGSGCVIASAAGFVDTMNITTVPASLVVTSVTGVTAPDTTTSGSVVTYSYAYKDAAGLVMSGLPASTVPTLNSADTTIAQITGLTAAGRAPGIVTLTLKGTAGLSTIKALAVLPLPFTGTTVAAVQPGQILKIVRDPAGPVFDANTVVSIGKAIGIVGPDTLSVRVSDVARAGTKKFSLTGVGPNDIAYANGTYTVNAPPAFTGTVTPAPVFPSATVWIHRDLVNDPVFDTSMHVFRGTTDSTFAALKVDTSTVRPDSFKVGKLSDLAAGGTYLFQFTRLGATLQTRRGSYVLPVATWGGTVTPSSAAPATRVVLRRGAGDPTFVAGTRVYLGGIRTFIDSYSADTAVVVVPPFGATGAMDMRISRMGATKLAVDGTGVLNSTSAALLDPFGYSNLTPDKPVAITTNGNTYIVESGTCPNGIAGSGGEKCDSYFKISNTTAFPDTVTAMAGWFDPATDGDLWICDGSALSNPAPNNVPACGNATGFAAAFDCCGAKPGDGFVLTSSYDPVAGNGEGPPEWMQFVLPAGKTYVIWVNMFSPNAAATLIQLNVIGLK